MTRRNHPEEAIQRAVATFLDVALPIDAVWFHPPNGGWRSKAEAGIFKAMGVKAGVPDIVVVYQGQAMFIELKPPGRSLSANQREFAQTLAAAGAWFQVAHSIDEVAGYLRGWGVPLKGTPC